MADAGESQVSSVEAEDTRRLHQELERLRKERTGHCNRLQEFSRITLRFIRTTTYSNQRLSFHADS